MLRHKIDLGEMRAVDRRYEKRDVIPRVKPPVKAEFRRGSDMASVVTTVKNNNFVELAAAVGSGKSTKCPLLLAQVMGKLVVHTIPFPIAAQRLADYLMSTPEGERVVYVDDVESDLPSHGVAIMTNAHLHERYTHNLLGDVSDAIAYLDESHESDCATATWRELAPAVSLFSRVIRATATADPGTVMKNHLPGRRSEMTYPKTAVASWSAHDVGKPWSGAAIDGNTMICIDRESVRTKLAVEYRDMGFDVRVHTSRTDYAAYMETEKRLRDPNGGIVLVLVDYAFRSSLTIPGLNRLVDSCEVAVPCVVDGAPSCKYRAAYDFEVQQFLGRGGRLPGEIVRLYRSAEPSPKYMCDLEELEADAANLLYRILGFRPPIKLQQFDFYSGDVPIDIAASLRGPHPLRLCPPESRVPWINGDQALLEEKKMETFNYRADIKDKKKYKPVSCHTLADNPRARSPPPPVPSHYSVTRVDIDGLDGYVSSRASSESGRVFTVDSDAGDNLSVFLDEDNPIYKKPKRIAKRVIEAREAAAAKLQQSADVIETSIDPVGSAAVDKPLPVLPTGDIVPATLTDQVASTAGTRRFGSVIHGVKHVHDNSDRKLNGKNKMVALADDQLGTYVHYHNMDTVDESNYFLRGLESVVQFAEGDGGKTAKGLPKSERVYAMHCLVDALNTSTAIAMGIQRLFDEISKRDGEAFQDLVDNAKMVETLHWMTNECGEAQARVRLYRDIMPFYMDYMLDKIEPAVELEQRVMLEMMKKFEDAAVKKDPDKLATYMRSLNSKGVKLAKLPDSRVKRAIAFD